MYHLQKVSGKSKVNATRLFGSFQRKTYGSNGTSKKVVVLLRTEYANGNSCFISLKLSVIPVSRLRGRFSVNGTDLYKW